jgi:hypothetical protein
MREQQLSRQQIMMVVLSKWHDAIVEAEERFARDDAGSIQHVRKIKEHARECVVRALEHKKGSPLLSEELRAGHEMFDDLSASFEYFKIIELHEEHERRNAGEAEKVVRRSLERVGFEDEREDEDLTRA